MKAADLLFAFGVGSFLGAQCGDAIMWVFAFGAVILLGTAFKEEFYP
jgi:hypothetical protein